MPPRRVARSSPVGGKSAGFVGGRNLAVALGRVPWASAHRVSNRRQEIPPPRLAAKTSSGFVSGTGLRGIFGAPGRSSRSVTRRLGIDPTW